MEISYSIVAFLKLRVKQRNPHLQLFNFYKGPNISLPCAWLRNGYKIHFPRVAYFALKFRNTYSEFR